MKGKNTLHSILYKIYFKLHNLKNNILDFYCSYINEVKFSADLLLIKVDAIGDYVIWQDSLKAYKEMYAGKKVLLLCNQIVYPIALQDSFFSEVWTVDRKKFLFSSKYRVNLLNRLCSCEFGEIISPVLSREYIYNDILVKMAVSRVKIGYNGDISNMTLKEQRKGNRYYSKLVDKPSFLTSELLVNAYFVNQVYNAGFVPQLPILPEGKQENLVIGSTKYVVFSISASYYPRAWSAVSFAEVASFLSKEYTIVLLGFGKADREKGDEFLKAISNSAEVNDLINKTSILETIAVIRNATLVIGNDSSAVHIASATRTPSICIAPGAHYKRFVPYPESISDKFFHPRVVVNSMPCFGCNYHCCFPIDNQLKCIKDVTVSMVMQELNNLLDDINKRKNESKNLASN